jgi:hypothetical protein
MLVRVSRVQRCGLPHFNNTLAALQASFSGSNRGPPVKMLSDCETWYCHRKSQDASARGLTMLVSRVPTHNDLGDAPMVRLQARPIGKAILQKGLYFGV